VRVFKHRFSFYDPETGVELSDIIEINTLELVKLPEGAAGCGGGKKVGCQATRLSDCAECFEDEVVG
jgi:hypothetical protein